MAKSHDENKDLRLVGRIAKINISDHTIHVNRGQKIGIRTLGRIDFLVHYCGWTLVWDNNVILVITTGKESNVSSREAKKAKKEHKLTDKTKKTSKKR